MIEVFGYLLIALGAFILAMKSAGRQDIPNPPNIVIERVRNPDHTITTTTRENGKVVSVIQVSELPPPALSEFHIGDGTTFVKKP